MSSHRLTLQTYFAAAAASGALIEVHLNHPQEDFQRQTGICYQAHAEFLVMGPEGAPSRVCVPYQSICWFRRLDDVV